MSNENPRVITMDVWDEAQRAGRIAFAEYLAKKEIALVNAGNLVIRVYSDGGDTFGFYDGSGDSLGRSKIISSDKGMTIEFRNNAIGTSQVVFTSGGAYITCNTIPQATREHMDTLLLMRGGDSDEHIMVHNIETAMAAQLFNDDAKAISHIF